MTTRAKWKWSGLGAACVVVLTIVAGIPTALTAGGSLLSIPDKVSKHSAQLEALEVQSKEQAVINATKAEQLREVKEGLGEANRKLDYLIDLELKSRR